MKINYNKKPLFILSIFKISIFSVFSILLVSCSSSNLGPQASHPAESPVGSDIMEGPGLFSGNKGAFYVVGGDKKVKYQRVERSRGATKSVSNMNLKETSKVLDDKIRQLERDQMELELLKKEIDEKLKN